MAVFALCSGSLPNFKKVLLTYAADHNQGLLGCGLAFGDVALSTNTYLPRNNGLSLTTYGNGDTIEYSYNNLGLVEQLDRLNGGETQTFEWGYAADGTLSVFFESFPEDVMIWTRVEDAPSD